MSPMTKLQPLANHYGHDVSGFIPPAEPGVFEQFPVLERLWEKAKTYLAVRSNDAHTLYSLSLAQSLLKHHPQADPLVVLPAILLHDIGWSQVDPQLVLSAIAPGAGDKELVLQHEKLGRNSPGNCCRQRNSITNAASASLTLSMAMIHARIPPAWKIR